MGRLSGLRGALPALILGFGYMAIFLRYTRASMLDVINSDYITTARSKGLKGSVVLSRHAFRNALVPVITVIGLQVALTLSGAVLTESVFNWPGLGTELIDYLNSRDYAAVQGLVTFFALIVVVVSVVVDIVNALVDPRVRY